MSPFACTMPFKKIVPKLRNTSWVSARTVVMRAELLIGPGALSFELAHEPGNDQSGDALRL